VSDCPNGRVLPFALEAVCEESLFRAGGLGAIYALGANQGDYHPEREPLLCVHGIEGSPVDLQGVVDRFRSSPFQLYALAYPDFHRRTSLNGDDLADELRTLTSFIGTGRDLRIVAHSMGGIVSRQALNQLAQSGADRFASIELYTADTPWHGYPGPSDTGFDGAMMEMVRVFLPAGLDDMRALSAMFQGDHQHPGLYGIELPDHFSIDVVFAQEGNAVLDYTEDVLQQLPAKLAEYYLDETPVRGDPRLVNYWKALISARA